MDRNGSPAVPPAPRRHRPHPHLEQFKRTWYFFRRNTLALVGLGIILSITAVAAYAVTLPVPWTSMQAWCATDYGPSSSSPSVGPNGTLILNCPSTSPYVCTYEYHPPTDAANYCGGHWYKGVVRSGLSEPGLVAPTVSLSPFNPGPMPLGALALSTGGTVPLYNIASELARGADWSLIFSVSIVGLGALVGLFVGALAGFYGGLLDDALMRVVDVFLSIPIILFVIVVVAVLSIDIGGGGQYGTLVKLGGMILGFVIVWWPFYARLVRGQVLVVREQKYVEAARAAGASRGRILMKHIIPNSMYPIFIQFSLDVGVVPLLVGALVFLGFGPVLFPNVPFPEWGALSALSVQDLQTEFLGSCYVGVTGCLIPWWQLFFPGLALFLYAISVNLLADGLRDALDPRLRR